MIQSSSVGGPLDEGGPTQRAAPMDAPVQLRGAHRDVLRRLLTALDRATDLTTAAAAVAVCVPAFADVAQLHLLEGSVNGDDPTDLVPGARLRVRGTIDDQGTRFQPGRGLSAGSALREAMESQQLVRRRSPRSSAAGAVARDPDEDLPEAGHGGDLLVVPLMCGGRTIGVLTLQRGPGLPPLSASDIETIQQVAAVTALRLDHLRLIAARAVTSGALRSTLSPVVPVGAERRRRRHQVPHRPPRQRRRGRGLAGRHPAAGRADRVHDRRRDGARDTRRGADGRPPVGDRSTGPVAPRSLVTGPSVIPLSGRGSAPRGFGTACGMPATLQGCLRDLVGDGAAVAALGVADRDRQHPEGRDTAVMPLTCADASG